MKLLNLGISLTMALFITISCGSNKKDQLSKLKQQETAINDKIRDLETDMKKNNSDSPDTDKFKFVGITDIRSSKFDHYIRVQGKLDGDQNAAVFAEVPGTITARYADVGQRVELGQVLAQIDDQQYRIQLESLETQYRFAADMYNKQKRLWDQKIGSEVQYLQSKTTKESLEQQIASLKQQIYKFKIKSPVSGTIEECDIKVGVVVSPDPRSAVYRVMAFRNLKVTAEVSEAYSSKVQTGDSLIVLFPDAGKRIASTVSFVSKYINPVNRTFLIETKIKGDSPDLKANMIAIVRINDYHSDNSILVPMNVIQNDQDGSYVYVIHTKDRYSAAFKQPVILGNIYNGVAEITRGLALGDKVISTGYQELIDGEYVRF